MSYEVRQVRKEDWEDIVKLVAQHDFPFPDFDNMLSAVVIVKNGKVISFGYIKRMVEAVFLPDKSSKKDIVASLKLLHEQLINQTRERKIRDVVAMSISAEYTEILLKHFGYERCKGDMVCLEVIDDAEG